VLGRLAVLRDGTNLQLPPSRKARGLLAYLAVTTRTHSRGRLCMMFWGLPDDPRAALRWGLTRLRTIIDAPDDRIIIANRDNVGLNLDSVSVDILSLRDAAKAGFASLSTEALRSAAQELEGDFLEDLDLPDCEEFQNWCTAQREETRLFRTRLLTALVERLKDAPDEALRHARVLSLLDPADEGAQASLVRLLRASGRWREAGEQFERAQKRLEEFSAIPTGALRRAAQVPLRADGPLQADAAAGPGADSQALLEPAALPLSHDVRFCRTADDVRIAYACTGDGPPLVKVANWLNHLEFDWQSPVWKHFLHGLAAAQTLIRYDARGSGLSDWKVEELSFAAFLRDLESVIGAIPIGRVPLLGVSQGAAISIAFAVKHPERVSHLVLYGGFARGLRRRGTQQAIEQADTLDAVIRHGWANENPAYRQLFTSLFIPGASLEQMQWFNDLQRVTTSPENARRMRSVFDEIDVVALLPKISVPTLVLHCSGDAIVPFEEGRLIAANIPNARFVALEGRNHLILKNDPARTRFLEEVTSFLRS
jgi:DNA-binding SARP family transcriptional activator/alpha-beta hydrolase superfamily lysophospholipase